MIAKSKVAAVFAALLLMVLLATTSNAKTFDATDTSKGADCRPSRASAQCPHLRRAAGGSHPPFFAGWPSTWVWEGAMGFLLLTQFALLWRQAAGMRSGRYKTTNTKQR